MNILKLFRKRNKISQIELADHLGVTQGFISQMENGTSAVPDNVISRLLANTCGWETEMLTEDDEVPQQEDTLVAYLKEQNYKLTQENIELHSRIAVLEYQIMMLEREKGKSVSNATEPVAHVG